MSLEAYRISALAAGSLLSTPTIATIVQYTASAMNVTAAVPSGASSPSADDAPAGLCPSTFAIHCACMPCTFMHRYLQGPDGMRLLGAWLVASTESHTVMKCACAGSTQPWPDAAAAPAPASPLGGMQLQEVPSGQSDTGTAPDEALPVAPAVSDDTAAGPAIPDEELPVAGDALAKWLQNAGVLPFG